MGDIIEAYLRESPAFCDVYNIIRFDSRTDLSSTEVYLEKTHLFIYSQPGWDDVGVANLVTKLGPLSQTIRVPHPRLTCLWPFSCNETRKFPGLSRHPVYGDSYLLGGVQRNEPLKALADAYLTLDVCDRIDLSRLLELDLALMERSDLTVEHQRTLEQVPIHPSIIRSFKLAFCESGARYTVDKNLQLTFSEYVDFYLNPYTFKRGNQRNAEIIPPLTSAEDPIESQSSII